MRINLWLNLYTKAILPEVAFCFAPKILNMPALKAMGF